MHYKRNIVVYISGAYTGDIDKNIEVARKAAIDLWERGYSVICPHTNTIHFEKDCKIGYDDYLEGDCEVLKRCNYILMLDNWENSKGAKIERETAIKNAIPVYYSIQDLEKVVNHNRDLLESFYSRRV